MHDNVQRLLPKVTPNPIGDSSDGGIANVLVPLVRLELLRHVGEGIVRRVERIDLLELEQLSIRELARFVHLAALQQIPENGQCRRPCADGHFRARFGQRLGDREAKPRVVRDPRDERPFPREIDGEHGLICLSPARYVNSPHP